MMPSAPQSDTRPTLIEQCDEHAWVTESQHAVAAGWILYARCHVCGTRRVDARSPDGVAPFPLSREVGLGAARGLRDSHRAQASGGFSEG